MVGHSEEIVKLRLRQIQQLSLSLFTASTGERCDYIIHMFQPQIERVQNRTTFLWTVISQYIGQ